MTARTLNGTWRVAGTAFLGVTQYQFQQNGPGVNATMVLGGPYGGVTRQGPGQVSDPRSLQMVYLSGCSAINPCPCSFTVNATVDPDLQGIRGTLSCAGELACGCDGQTQAWQLQRQ